MAADDARTAMMQRETDTAAPRVGRPPRVSAQAIIEAAIELGLDRVTLKQVADHLGVGVATLYRHVRSRDELLRMAAFRVVLSRRMPRSQPGRTVHWAEVALGFAASLYETFVGEPQLIHEMARGRIGPDAEVDFLEQFLAELKRHGFSARDSIRLHHALAMMAIGAAAGALSLTAAAAAGQPHAEAMARVLAERDADELPEVRAAVGEFLDISPAHWLLALRDLLAGFAQARGESLPEPLFANVLPDL
jgi:AcrR family transcriptional regulator